MINVDQASPEVKALADAISALSQQLFSASWHTGCELPIWQAMAQEDSSWRRRGDGALLHALAGAWLNANGWVVWDEHFDRLTWLTDEEWFQVRREQEANDHS